MKKCPECAEEIQDAAVKCRHCQADLAPKPMHAREATSNAPLSPPPPKSTLRTVGKIILAMIVGPFVIGLGIALWQVAIPLILFVILYKKTKLSPRVQLGISAAVLVLCVGFSIWMGKHTPVLDVTAPKDAISLAAKTVTVQGTVKPSNSTLTINNQSAPVNSDGTFSNEVPLKQGENRLEIAAHHDGFSASHVLTITRTLTQEEEQAIADQKAKEEAAKKAEELAWQKSKPGQICKKHPNWMKDDCERIADNRYWVGMSYDMLVYMRGKPNSINPSNYGRETQYQYCWYDYTPSCFYDQNGDDLLDAFN